jgi:hypothetical protein
MIPNLLHKLNSILNKKYFFVIITFTILTLLTIWGYSFEKFNLTLGIKNAIRSDAIGYYAWIHLFFNPHDTCFSTYYQASIDYMPEVQWGLKPIVLTSCFVPIYTMGMAIAWLPFVIVIGIPLSLLMNDFVIPTQIFSVPFQISITLSSVVFVSLGIYFLYSALEILFDTKTVRISIISLLLGSNLIHYATLDGIFTHALSFFINAISVYLFLKFMYRRNDINSLSLFLIGFIPSLGVIVRSTNFTFLLLTGFVLIMLRKLPKHFFNVVIGVIVGLIPLMFQLAYWKYATGNIFYFPYWDYEGFSLLRTSIFSILFSFNPHGLVPYSPIILIALIGFILGFLEHLKLNIIFSCVFLINISIISSWSSPYGGGGLGNRFFVDFYPILIFGIAYFFSRFKKNLVILTILFITSAISLRLTYLYWLNEIDYGGENFWDLYTKMLSLL